jgi:hypothetical protein
MTARLLVAVTGAWGRAALVRDRAGTRGCSLGNQHSPPTWITLSDRANRDTGQPATIGASARSPCRQARISLRRDVIRPAVRPD